MYIVCLLCKIGFMWLLLIHNPKEKENEEEDEGYRWRKWRWFQCVRRRGKLVKLTVIYLREFGFKTSQKLAQHTAQTWNALQSGLSWFATSRPQSTQADLLKLVTTCERGREDGGFGEVRLSWRHHRCRQQQKATWLRTLKIYGMMLLKLSS